MNIPLVTCQLEDSLYNLRYIGLPLCVQTYLYKANIKTVKEFLESSVSDIESVKYIGAKGRNQIRNVKELLLDIIKKETNERQAKDSHKEG